MDQHHQGTGPLRTTRVVDVEAQELGRATIRTERLDQAVEQFTIRGEPTGAGADILLEWERTRAARRAA